MERFKNILCVVEPSQESVSAIERASLLAQRNDADLRVLGVVESIPVDTKDRIGFPSAAVRDLILQEAAAEIERAGYCSGHTRSLDSIAPPYRHPVCGNNSRGPAETPRPGCADS